MGSEKTPDKLQLKNFYPSILESIAEGIVVIGIDKKILFMNKMAKGLVGLHGEAVEGEQCINLHKKNESSVPLCLNVAPLSDSEGNIVGIIENFRPMSEAIRAIESLEKSNIVLAQEKNKHKINRNAFSVGLLFYAVGFHFHTQSFAVYTK